MTELDALNIRRLLVALDVLQSDVGDWTTAVDLAALVGAELQGLFVQDADLIGLASLPFAHEVGRVSGQSRPLARDSVESVLKRRVERTVSALVRAGRMRNVAVTHTIARGKLVRQALAQGEQGDVVFLIGPSPRSERSRARPSARIMLWYDAGPAAQRSIEFAIYLAHRTDAELLIGFPFERIESATELHEHFGALLAKAPHAVQLSPFRGAGVDAILDAARRARVARIVLSAQSPLVSEDALEQLRTAFHGDLVVVR